MIGRSRTSNGDSTWLAMGNRYQSSRAFVVRFLQILFVASISFLSIRPIAYGQLAPAPLLNSVNDLTQMPIPGSGHDYQHLLGETVNFSNGSVSFKISFPTPSGRGISLPYAWSYNSAAVNTLNAPDGVTPQWNYLTYDQWPRMDGWNLVDGIPWGTVQEFSQMPSGTIPPGKTATACNTESGITFTDVSGVMHNLPTGARAAAATGINDYYQCAAVLVLPPLGDAQVVATLSPESGVSLGSSFGSADPFVVQDKNGTIYSFALSASQNTVSGSAGLVEDRNGNFVTLPGANGALWTDSAGRSGPVVSSYPPPSVVTEDESYSATWGTVNVSYTVASAGGAPSPYGCEGSIPATVSGTKNVLSVLNLPNGTKYQFFYNNSYGLLSEIIFPDGGWIKYSYQLAPGYSEQFSVPAYLNGQPLSSEWCVWQYQTPVLAQRTVSFDGTNVAQTQAFQYSTTWQYSNNLPNGWTAKSTTVTTQDNVLNLSSKTVYAYLPAYPPPQQFATSALASQIPVEDTITYYDWGQTSAIKKVKKTWYDLFSEASETTTLYTNSGSGTLTTETAYTYTSGLCSSVSTAPFTYLLEQDDFAFAVGTSPGAIVKKTKYNYKCFAPSNPSDYSDYFPSNAPSNWGSNYQGIVVAPKVYSVVVEDGANNILAATQYNYDESALSSVLATQHDSAAYSSVSARGNLTSVLRCLPAPTSQPQQPTSSTPICSAGPKTTYTFDITGQPHSMTDPCGNVSCSSDMIGSNHTTMFSFTDSPSGGNAPGNSNAYLTQITNAKGFQDTFQYDYGLGYLTQSTDVNVQSTNYIYNTPNSNCSLADGQTDGMHRLSEVDYPDGGKVIHCYNDDGANENGLPTSVTQTLHSTTGPWISKGAEFDGMAHVIRTDLMITANVEYDTVATAYDGEGRVRTVYNPYATGARYAGGSGPYTTSSYDATGRKIEVQQQDGTLLQWCYDGVKSNPAVSFCSATQLGSSSPGTRADFTDETGNEWERAFDVFGDITDVMEPNGNTQTPSMETDYSYDTLLNLKSVTQNGNGSSTVTRTFNYDALSRLTQSDNPETGWICYGSTGNPPVAANGSNCAPGYDANGNLGSKTDSRGIQIGYSYDVIDRLLGKSYTTPSNPPNGYAATAPVSYTYDQGPAYPTGRLTGMTDGPGSESWTYDQMGRIASITRSILTPQSNQTGSAFFQYNADGSQNTGTYYSYPTSPDYQYLYDTAGRPTDLQFVGSSSPTLTGGTYDPAQHLIGLMTGPSSQLVQITTSNQYNSRLQPSQFQTVIPAQKVNGLPIPAQTIYNHTLCYDSCYAGAPTANNGNIQSDTDKVVSANSAVYKYDTLNRLVYALATNLWGDTYTYDAFGNLYQKTPIGSGKGESLQAQPTSQNQLANIGLVYDPAGNLLTDNMGTHYTYDAENHIATAGSWSYSYDGVGKRVLRTSGGTSGSTYWYGADDRLTDEQTVALNNGSPAQYQHDFYFNGRLALREEYLLNPSHQTDNFYWIVSDQVGSSRVSVNVFWNPATGQDPPAYTNYYPFGGYITPPTDTTLEQRFTGKIRDTETGNDYFGARYYTGSVGRFVSPDWSAKMEPVPYAKLDSPQTLNLYAYVGNNPLSRIDKDGHYECGGSKEQCAAIETGLQVIRNADANLKPGSSGKALLDKALEFYGAKDQKNGVKIDFNAKAPKALGSTKTENGVTTISFGKDAFTPMGPTGKGETVAHEGTHGVDQHKDPAHPMPTTFWQFYDTEYHAYQAESAVDKGLGSANETDKHPVWFPGITPQQRTTNITREAYSNACLDVGGCQ